MSIDLIFALAALLPLLLSTQVRSQTPPSLRR